MRSQGAQNPADTYEAIRWILSELGERHSFLIAPNAIPDGGNEASTGQQVQNTMPSGRAINSRIAWIEVPPLITFGPHGVEKGQSYKALLKDTLTRLDSEAACGWIVDLRENVGGNMWPMLDGLDPLLGAGPFGYFVTRGKALQPWLRTADGISPFAALAAIDRPAFTLSHSDRPIAVLLGPHTVSSGEMVAIALHSPQSRSFGSATAGYTTGNVVHKLADGAVLLLTETRVADKDGIQISGPIIPDELVRDEDVVSRAEAWLLDRCSPRKALVSSD